MTNHKFNKILKFGIYVFIVVCLEIGICCLKFAKPTFAQEVSLSISPPITEITIQPGKSFSQTFTVKNDGEPVVIVPAVLPFEPLDKEGHVELVEDQNSVTAFAGWFTFDPAPVSLGTTGSHDYYLKVSPPAGAEEKDYYFTFIAEVQNDNNLGFTNSQSQVRVGANILVNVSKDGNPQKKASIIKFAAPQLIDSFTGLTYEVLIGNSGYSFFKPIGKITVDQIFGSTSVLNLAPLNILVGGEREISCIQGENLIPCKLPGKFLIGIYRSNLSFTIDGNGESVEKQIYTIAFPFTILFGLIIVFIFYRAVRKSKS